MELVCGECREARPHLLSCIHTFAAPKKTSPLGTYDRDEENRATQELVEQIRHPNW